MRIFTQQATGTTFSEEKLTSTSRRGSNYTDTSTTSYDPTEATNGHIQAVGVPVDVEKRVPNLYKYTKLAPLDLTFNNVTEEDYTVDLKHAHKKALKTQVLRASTKAQASVLFVVKRPWCPMCHEQGFDLKKLIEEFPAQSVGAFACIKEVEEDTEGLLSLYQNHFHFPFYRDTTLTVFKTLGIRKINIFTGLRRYYSAMARLERKGLSSKRVGKVGEMALGGVMIFDRKGRLQYAYKEEIGLELPLDEIRMAIKGIMN